MRAQRKCRACRGPTDERFCGRWQSPRSQAAARIFRGIDITVLYGQLSTEVDNPMVGAILPTPWLALASGAVFLSIARIFVIFPLAAQRRSPI